MRFALTLAFGVLLADATRPTKRMRLMEATTTTASIDTTVATETVPAGMRTPDRRTQQTSDPWAPKGWYNGLENDREEFLRQEGSMEGTDMPEEIPSGMRTPTNEPRPNGDLWAPNARYGYDGSVEDRARYLRDIERSDDEDLFDHIKATTTTTTTTFQAMETTTFASPTKPSRGTDPAPWAPRGGFSGLARDKVEYLGSLRN
jgi:hypothetical protein